MADEHGKEHNALRRAMRNAPGVRAPDSWVAAGGLPRSQQQCLGPPRDKGWRGNPGIQRETGRAGRVFPNGLKQRPQFKWRSDADGLDTSTAGSPNRHSTVALGKAWRGTSRRALKNIGILLFRTKNASRVRSDTLFYNWVGLVLTHRHNGYRFLLRIQATVNRLGNRVIHDD